MMSNKISILKIRKILFRIVSGSRHPIPHSQPTWPHTVITSEDLKPSPTHTKILNNVEQLFRFLFASGFRFFCNDNVRIDITMTKVTVHLGMLGFPAGDCTLLLTVPRIPIRQCSFVRTKTAFVESSSLLLRIGIGPPCFHCCNSRWLVLTHTISSALLKPHFWSNALPTSSESLLGNHRNRKLGVAASDSIGSEASCVMSEKRSRPPCSEMTITSKRMPCAGGAIGLGSPHVSRDTRLSECQFTFRDVGGWERW